MTRPQINPILKKELRTGARTIRFPIALMIYALFMSVVSYFIIVLATNSYDYYYGNIINYSTFTQYFQVCAYMQLAVICLMMPVLTAGLISGEREKQTLDIMLTTPVPLMSIMVGKLGVALCQIFLYLFCSLPAMTICFFYGGIRFEYLFVFLIGILIVAIFVGSIGLWCSAVFRRTVPAVVITIIIEGLFFGATLLIPFVDYIAQYARYINEDYYQVRLGGSLLTILLNPVTTFVSVITRMCTGENLVRGVLVDGMDLFATPKWFSGLAVIWIPLSVILILAVSVGFLALGARNLDASRRKSNQRRERRVKSKKSDRKE